MSPSSGHVPQWLDRTAAYAWRFLVISVALAAAAYVFRQLYVVFVPIIMALLLATLLVPPSRWLRSRGLPDALVALVLVAGLVGAFVGIFAFLGPQIGQELSDFGEQMQEGADDAVEWAIHGPLPIDAAQTRDLLARAGQAVRENLGVIGSGFVAGAVLLVEIVIGLLIAVVLLFFFLKDGDRLTGWLLARAPAERREELAALARRGWETFGGFLRGTAIVALVDALGIGVGIWLIGVPLVLPLAVLTFFGGFFPIVGANVAGLVAILVALVSLGPFEALLTFFVVLAVQQLETNVLEPVIVGKAVSLHPVVIILVITAGAVLGGIMGAFLAVPFAAVAASVGNELRLRAEAAELAARADPQPS